MKIDTKHRPVLIFFLFLMGCMSMDMNEVMKVQDDHEQRITFLENWVGGLNESIRNLQKLIQLEENKDYVTSVIQTAEGVKITFMQSEPILIRNGEKGDTGETGDPGQDGEDGKDGENGSDGADGADAPVIGVKKQDGRYYWTLTTDGHTEFLKDAAGHPLPVTGEKGPAGDNGKPGTDGKPGLTPELGISPAGNWTVNGAEILVNGKPLPATGPQGDKGNAGKPGNGGNGAESSTYFKTIDASDPEVVSFTLKDGSTFVLPKWQDIAFQLNTAQESFRIRAGEQQVIGYSAKHIVSLTVQVPEGWKGEVDTLARKITVTAPEAGQLFAVKDGDLSIVAGNKHRQQIVVTRPLHQIQKTYRILLAGCPSPDTDVYLVETPEGRRLAEVCYEYIKGYTETAKRRSLVIYPWNPRTEEYDTGYVVVDGGRVGHDGYGYRKGNLPPCAYIDLDVDGKWAMEGEATGELHPQPDIVGDFAGNTYGIVKIGRQYWMKENFRNTVLRHTDGTTKPLERPTAYDAYEPGSESIYSWIYDYSKVYKDPAKKGFQFCPDGWHIPNSVELRELTVFIPNSRDLCAVSGEWQAPASQKNTDLSGFGALPGGWVNTNVPGHPHEGLHAFGEYWSSSELLGVNNVVLRVLYNSEDYAFVTPLNYAQQRSIRCIRDDRYGIDP